MSSNLYVTQAADFRKVFVATNGNDFIDLTEKTITCWAVKNVDSVFGIPFAVEIIDAVNGEYAISLDSEQTANMDPTKIYIYDITMSSDIIGSVVVLESGNLHVKASIGNPSNQPIAPIPSYRLDINAYPELIAASPDDFVLVSSGGSMFKVKVSNLISIPQ